MAGVETAPGDVEALVLEQSRTRLRGILKTIEVLQRMFYEDVVSCDLKLDVPLCNQRFDKETMEELHSETNRASRSPSEMLCAVEVGLSSRAASANDQSHFTVLLKAKVVSDEVVRSIFRQGRIRASFRESSKKRSSWEALASPWQG